jgi:hypothetical protein
MCEAIPRLAICGLLKHRLTWQGYGTTVSECLAESKKLDGPLPNLFPDAIAPDSKDRSNPSHQSAVIPVVSGQTGQGCDRKVNQMQRPAKSKDEGARLSPRLTVSRELFVRTVFRNPAEIPA